MTRGTQCVEHPRLENDESRSSLMQAIQMISRICFDILGLKALRMGRPSISVDTTLGIYFGARFGRIRNGFGWGGTNI